MNEAGELQYACDHPETQLRTRTTSNGGKMYGEQCLVCGRLAGTWRPKAVALRNGVPPAWDDALEAAWHDRYRLQYLERQQRAAADEEARRSAWWNQYQLYLDSDEWRAKRALVLRRAAGLCEGCRLRPPVQVHHLTYEHVGDEFLWELVAVCLACHERAHGRPTVGP